MKHLHSILLVIGGITLAMGLLFGPAVITGEVYPIYLVVIGGTICITAIVINTIKSR